jgi:hypothetical protein
MFIDQRSEQRARTNVKVRVVYDGMAVMGTARNMSTSGVFITGLDKLNLRVDQTCELTFAVNLGNVSKIHRRRGVVRHTDNGGVGLQMFRVK